MGSPQSVTRKFRRRRQHAATVALTLIILLVMSVGFVYYKRAVVGVRDYAGAGNGTVVMVRVEEGDSVSSLAKSLVSHNVVGSRRALMTVAADTPVTLQAGYYPLQEEMSAREALKTLGDVRMRRGVVDIPNGLTLDDVHVVGGQTRKGIYTLISEQTCRDTQHCTKPEELRKAVSTTPAEQLGVAPWALQRVNARGEDPRRIEGLIVPGVHLFDPTADAVDIMSSIVRDSTRTIEGTGLLQAAQTSGMDPYDMIIGASLVEREAPPKDFDKVARVILNRLAVKQRLEFDSTVNYGLPDQEVATRAEDRGRETPWNTYAKHGLPATPIASPSVQALRAMQFPAAGDWLYFVTTHKDGRTVFNRDFEAHKRAAEEASRNGVLDSRR